MPPNFVYLPDTHLDEDGNPYVPDVIKIGEICYYFVEKIRRDPSQSLPSSDSSLEVQKETVCWDEVIREFDSDTSDPEDACPACCNRYVVYSECCDIGDPEMLLTVTGTSGTINWCGQTWSLPDDSGEEKSACPTYYLKNQTTRTYASPPSQNLLANHIWRYGIATLALTRTYAADGAPAFNFYNIRYEQAMVRVRNKTDNVIPTLGASPYGSSRPVPPPPGYAYKFSAGVIASSANNYNGSAFPVSFSNYTLTAPFFGSYTTGGVTYAWAKGEGWPT
jgi:hypothetical protein